MCTEYLHCIYVCTLKLGLGGIRHAPHAVLANCCSMACDPYLSFKKAKWPTDWFLVILSSTGLTSILILSTDLTDCLIPFPIPVFLCFTQIPKKHNLLAFWLRNTWFICSSMWRWCCHDDKYHLRSRSHLFKQNTATCPFVLYLGGKNYFYFCLSYM